MTTPAASASLPPAAAAEANRHVALAVKLIGLTRADNRIGMARLIEQLAADPTVKPWLLVMSLARFAARQPRAQGRW